jgi:hypothetical protein
MKVIGHKSGKTILLSAQGVGESNRNISLSPKRNSLVKKKLGEV